jgi:hypothetical protein
MEAYARCSGKHEQGVKLGAHWFWTHEHVGQESSRIDFNPCASTPQHTSRIELSTGVSIHTSAARISAAHGVDSRIKILGKVLVQRNHLNLKANSAQVALCAPVLAVDVQNEARSGL